MTDYRTMNQNRAAAVNLPQMKRKGAKTMKNGIKYEIIWNNGLKKWSVEEYIGGGAWISRFFADTYDECKTWLEN